MINAYAIQVLDIDIDVEKCGYRFASIKKTEPEAILHAIEVSGEVIPLHDIDWLDAETPF